MTYRDDCNMYPCLHYCRIRLRRGARAEEGAAEKDIAVMKQMNKTNAQALMHEEDNNVEVKGHKMLLVHVQLLLHELP